MADTPPKNATLSLSRAEINERDPSFRITPDDKSPYTVLLTQHMLNIGSEARQDISIQVAGIDPRHARIVLEGVTYRLYDLTEYGGVQVRGRSIDGSVVLKDGDLLRLQDQQGRGANLVYSNPVERALGSASVGRLYPLDKSPFIIGRDPAAGLKLDTLAVSWHHCEITEQNGAHLLRDLGSTNGTFVNDRKLNAPYRLQAEDVIRVDLALLVYKGKGLFRLPSTQAYQIDGVNLGMTYQIGFPPKPLNTMRNASIAIRPKEFIAIIGGSGSGKSTLMRALNGANHATEGETLINGLNLYQNYELYQPIIGYVPQTDIVQDALTVEQSLYFGARLRFPNESKPQLLDRVTRVLEVLELTDFRQRFVGRLSGGQRKRVSIAMELMAEPAILFMDEPSSGLDPGLDLTMMDFLRRVANRGYVVIIVTHTTENIHLCDQVAFMARGHLVYYGPPKGALNFFGANSYAEMYNKVQHSPEALKASNETMTFKPLSSGQMVASKDKVSAVDAARLWAEKYQASDIYQQAVTKRLHANSQNVQQTMIQKINVGNMIKPQESALANKRLRGARQGSFTQQTSALLARTLAVVRRDTRTMVALLLLLPLVGLFLGFISRDPIDNTAGQMLVSRGDDSAYLLLMDKIPVQPVATVAAAASTAPATDSAATPAPSTGTTGKTTPQVRGVATFAPAQDAQRLLFMLALTIALFGIFASAYTIVTEKSLFLRERMVNLRRAPYLASKMIVYTGLALLSCVLLVVALLPGVRLPEQGLLLWGPLELLISMGLTAAAGVSLGILLSAMNRQTNAVTYAVLAMIFVQILFPGVLFKMEGALEPISRLTITRWSLEALGGTANFTARDAEGRIVVETVPVNPKTGQPLKAAPPARQYFPTPPAAAVLYPTDAQGLLIRWGVLLGFSVVFLGLAAVALNKSESF
jgi:ABC transport system ATP-binding/permease protein